MLRFYGRHLLRIRLSPATIIPISFEKLHRALSFPTGGPGGPGISPAAMVISDGRSRDGSSQASRRLRLWLSAGLEAARAGQAYGFSCWPCWAASAISAFMSRKDLDKVTVTSVWPLSAAGPGALDRAGVRIRERLSRHRQCRGDGHLHQLAAAAISPWCGRGYAT